MTITLTINDQRVVAPDGATILEARTTRASASRRSATTPT